MKNDIYIENEGVLYRGFARAWPEERWSKKEHKFVPYVGHVPKPEEWGYIIDEAEAKKMMEAE
ncbi:MAG TPA: hypothetical protein PK580_00035 [Nitrosomonas halophila]|nr:hypothetical protein [Nitrosomonas halophila]